MLLKYFLTFIALIALAFPIKANANELQPTYNPQSQLTQEEFAKIQEQEWSRQLIEYSKTLQGKKGGQCVLALRNYFGISRSEIQGAAKSTRINSQKGKVGAIIVFKRMSPDGHVALQISTPNERGDILYVASNEGGYYKNGRWYGDEKFVIKTININDRRISGYRIIKTWT